VISADESVISRLHVQHFTRGELFSANGTSETSQMVNFLSGFANEILVVNFLATATTFRTETSERKTDKKIAHQSAFFKFVILLTALWLNSDSRYATIETIFSFTKSYYSTSKTIWYWKNYDLMIKPILCDIDSGNRLQSIANKISNWDVFIGPLP